MVDLQIEFARCIARLILWAETQNIGLTFGEAYRTPEQAALNAQKGSGIVNSNHTKRLAVDLLMFAGPVYVTDSEAYKPLGDYWKTLHPLACYGGDFKSKDANHFSFEYQGVK